MKPKKRAIILRLPETSWIAWMPSPSICECPPAPTTSATRSNVPWSPPKPTKCRCWMIQSYSGRWPGSGGIGCGPVGLTKQHEVGAIRHLLFRGFLNRPLTDPLCRKRWRTLHDSNGRVRHTETPGRKKVSGPIPAAPKNRLRCGLTQDSRIAGLAYGSLKTPCRN